jgi:hypothetical protein
MKTEFLLRRQAIRLRFGGAPVSMICRQLGRSREWFYKWWDRYSHQGADALIERSHAPHTSPHQLSHEVRQAIYRIRQRLMRRRGPRDRYRLAGAPTIRHELEVLGYRPLPSLRSIERLLQRTGLTQRSFRFAAVSRRRHYPGPQAHRSNQVHQLDTVGPRYLKGSSVRYYFLVYQDVFDHALYIEFHRTPNTEVVLEFVVRAWHRLGLPRYLQVDNDWLFASFGRWPGALNRFIRLALWVRIELVFIPEGEPCWNGAVEHRNGWFQTRLLAIPLHNPSHVRRELQQLLSVCWHEHLHANLGFRTTQAVRHTSSLRRLPANFRRPAHLSITVGKLTFIRKVRQSGRITVLGVKVRVGKRRKYEYVRATLFTRTALLKIYDQHRLIKTVDFPLRRAA